MKVVVTGASGSLGTALLHSESTMDWEVVGVARRRPNPTLAPYDRALWVSCDIGTDDGFDVLAEICADADAVVHLAWAIHPPASEPAMSRTNSIGTINVLRAVAHAGVGRLVAASSVAAYSPAGRTRRVGEDWPCGGVSGSAYSAGKVDLERRLAAFAKNHPATAVGWVRPCGIVQPDASAQLASWTLPPWIPHQLAGRRWLPVPLWSGARVQVMHADDVAELVARIVARGATGPFNATAEPVMSAGDLAAILGGFRFPVSRRLLSVVAWLRWRVGLQPLHPGWLTLLDKVSLVDAVRAREELGWQPTRDGMSALAEVIGAVASGRSADSPPLTGSRTFGRGRPTRQSQSTFTLAWKGR